MTFAEFFLFSQMFNGRCRFFTYGRFNAKTITINGCCNMLKGFPRREMFTLFSWKITAPSVCRNMPFTTEKCHLQLHWENHLQNHFSVKNIHKKPLAEQYRPCNVEPTYGLRLRFNKRQFYIHLLPVVIGQPRRHVCSRWKENNKISRSQESLRWLNLISCALSGVVLSFSSRVK